MKLNICFLYRRLLKKYSKIRNIVSNTMEEAFDSEPVYNEKYLKTKIKFYEGKVNTNSLSDKVLNKGSYCICILVILIDSAVRMGKNYYPQVVFGNI